MLPSFENLPEMSALASRFEQRMSERVEHDLTDAHWAGFDELFQYLKSTAETFRDFETVAPIAGVIERLTKDFETALFSFLCGMDQAAFDAMRDAMEVGYLLRDFNLWPDRIAEWLSLTGKERWNKFSPNALRQRFANHTGVNVTDLLDSKEYGTHSAMLHVSPSDDGIVQRGISTSTLPQFGASASLADILHHARDTVFLLHEMLVTFCDTDETVDVSTLVPSLPAAYEHTMKSFNSTLMWMDIGRAMAGTRSDASS